MDDGPDGSSRVEVLGDRGSDRPLDDELRSDLVGTTGEVEVIVPRLPAGARPPGGRSRTRLIVGAVVAVVAVAVVAIVASAAGEQDRRLEEPMAASDSASRSSNTSSAPRAAVDGGGETPEVDTSAATSQSPVAGAQETTADSSLAVQRVIDGDTFVLADGRRVRLAQVDGPETSDCFGSEATAALVDLIDGRSVTLRRPSTGPATDRYGRTLADVYIGDVSVNETLVATGAAEWYEAFADEDADLARRLQIAETAARSAGLGLWSACGAAAPPNTPAPSVTQPLVASPTTAQPSSSGNCHAAYPDDCIPPAPPDLNCPQIGRKVHVDHAFGDPHRLDADKDGWGCESYG